jgi:hypothetical protein
MKTVTKTAISVPSAVFEAAEQLSKQLGMSRSQLYSEAVAAFIKEQQPKMITEALNEIYADEVARLDPVVEQIQYASLPREEW